MLDHLWLILFFPLAGALLNGLAGRRLGKKSVSFTACAAVGLSFLASSKGALDLWKLPPEGRSVEQALFTWIDSGAFRAEAGFQLDPLSAIMILVVSGVSFLIHIYSIGYMHEDRDFSRYFAFLNLFVFSMLLLVLANNLLLLYVGWEGVGLCSYLLIGFWFERRAAAAAATKAFIVNRIGDFGFAIGILLLFFTFGTLDHTEIFQRAPEKLQGGGMMATAITLLLFVGATGKSAQLPLYVWLPDAMEGPTPVSALIHAATMVTAGVYMVARFHVLYELAPFSLSVVAILGALTAIFAASIGLVQNDMKRVMAYSTISQLGYMFLGCGVGAFAAAIFHLMTHAFFKALLFLGAGSVMHALSGETDLRRMGALKERMLVTFWTMALGCATLAGMPPLSAFFSKDEILWRAWSSPYGHPLLWFVGVATAGLTAFYAFRVLFVAFLGPPRIDGKVAQHLHESPKVMTVPMVVLAVLSVVGGSIGVPAVFGGGNQFEAFLASVFGAQRAGGAEVAHGSAGLELFLMAVSTFVALGGIWTAYRFYVRDPELPWRTAARFRKTYDLLLNKYYVDELYDLFIVEPLRKGAVFLWKAFDIQVVDRLVNGIASLVAEGSLVLRRFQTGLVPNYVLFILVGVVAVVGYLAFGR
ncbi:MAG: NADH-quinone oxidoreductase subunit L [candidate division NC10 bacterium]|nr:NADH-quinone oxidoreductase subunit L [candidate division NC10 bacterium]